MEDHNRLENFFRQQLQNYEAVENGWNIPPDDVWENVAPQVYEEKKRRKYALIWIWLGGLLLIGFLGYYLLHKEQQLEQLDEKLNKTEIALKEIVKELDELKLNQKIESKEKKEDSNATNSINEPETTTEQKIISKGKSITPSENRTAVTKSASIENILKSIAATKEESQPFESSPIEQKDRLNPQGNYAKLDILKPSPLLIEKKILPILSTKNTAQISQNRKVWLKVHGTTLALKRHVKNSDLTNLGFVNRGLTGFETGIHIGLDFKKRWSIETGIDYFNFQIINERKKKFSFNADTEVLNNAGLFESSITVENLNNPTSSNGELVFERSASDFIQNGTEINTSFNSTTTIDHLQIPLLLQYKLVDRRMVVDLRAGFVWTYVVHHQSALDNVISDNAKLKFKSGTISPLNGINQYTISYQLGLGFEYRFDKNWGLTIEPSLQKGLSPHMEFNNGTQFLLDKLGVFAGIKYRL